MKIMFWQQMRFFRVRLHPWGPGTNFDSRHDSLRHQNSAPSDGKKRPTIERDVTEMRTKRKMKFRLQRIFGYRLLSQSTEKKHLRRARCFSNTVFINLDVPYINCVAKILSCDRKTFLLSSYLPPTYSPFASNSYIPHLILHTALCFSWL